MTTLSPSSAIATLSPFSPPLAPTASFHSVTRRIILSGSSACFIPQVCGLKLCVAAKLKITKALRRHGWHLPRKLEVHAVDKGPDCSDAASPPEKVIVSEQQAATLSSQMMGNSNVMENEIISSSPLSSPVLKTGDDSPDEQPGSVTSLCIAVIGAAGELARNKVFPALFALYYSGFLPQNVGIFGYSRKSLTDQDLRSLIEANLTCRVDHHENCEEKLDAFLKRTYIVEGASNNRDGMAKLNSKMEQIEVLQGTHAANRIFYLAVPQEALLDVALSLADFAQTKRGWNRVIVEKPFGFHGVSSNQITKSLLSKFEEKQLYRIDHLLGKDLIENLTVLRFSNLVFEPLWSRAYIRNVQVIFSEETATEASGRYFGKYGIIRDIVHSHILQTIALFAMEPPVSLDGEDIRDEKVKVLRSIRKLDLEDVVLGQLKDSSDTKEYYTKFLTPTFCAAAMYIDNARWDGVPFFIKTGMGLSNNRVEIRIQFRHVPGNLYRERFGHDTDLDTNELILRDQPEEDILLKVNNKVPGLGLQLDASELNLLYKDKYNEQVPDSYEHLILDVIDGDNHLFMRSDEVAVAWNILTPIIDEIDRNKLVPELYEVGDRGPVNAYYLAAKHGVRYLDD